MQSNTSSNQNTFGLISYELTINVIPPKKEDKIIKVIKDSIHKDIKIRGVRGNYGPPSSIYGFIIKDSLKYYKFISNIYEQALIERKYESWLPLKKLFHVAFDNKNKQLIDNFSYYKDTIFPKLNFEEFGKYIYKICFIKRITEKNYIILSNYFP